MKPMKTPALIECKARSCPDKKKNVDADCVVCSSALIRLVDLKGSTIFQTAGINKKKKILK